MSTEMEREQLQSEYEREAQQLRQQEQTPEVVNRRMLVDEILSKLKSQNRVTQNHGLDMARTFRKG